MFARQVHAHGRPDDVLIVLSTSGRSPNLLAAVEAAREIGMRTWAFTGLGPNPLAELCDEALCCPSDDSQVVQELHLISVHLLCEYVDRTLPGVLGLDTAPATVPRGCPDVSAALALGDLVAAGAVNTDGAAHPNGVPHPFGNLHPNGAVHPNGAAHVNTHANGAAHPNGTGHTNGIVRPHGAGHVNGDGSRS
jgi:D-sedoheptulose 7-phosphate isomerase